MELSPEDHCAIDIYLVKLLTAVQDDGFQVEEARAELAAAFHQLAKGDLMFKARIRTNPIGDDYAPSS